MMNHDANMANDSAMMTNEVMAKNIPSNANKKSITSEEKNTKIVLTPVSYTHLDVYKRQIQDFGTLYHPTNALVFYQNNQGSKDTYVEHFDMDKNGNPINAVSYTHLDVYKRQARNLSKIFNSEIRLTEGKEPLKTSGTYIYEQTEPLKIKNYGKLV